MSYKILVFGRKILSKINKDQLKNSNAEISTSSYPSHKLALQEIDSYDIVITDLRTFKDGNRYQTNDERIFRKSLIRALEGGSYLCFLHYSENTNSNNNFGLKILDEEDIFYTQSKEILLDGKVKNNLFRRYLKKWGASTLLFKEKTGGNFDDIFYKHDKGSLGFSIAKKNGLYIYLPFQQNEGDKIKNTEGINTLINSLLNYRSKKATEIPDWANKSYFEDEQKIVKEIEKLNKEIEKKEKELDKFVEAKSLLTSREYNLEKKVPRFFNTHFGLEIEKEETFNEDFWILDGNGERSLICEVKSINKGFKKSFVFKLYNHRDEYKLGEDFPGLLIVNHHLQAGSWEDKNRPIDPQDYSTASEYNILILRVEDIVNLWDGLRKEEITDNIFTLFKENSGWLKVDSDYQKEFYG